MSNQAMSAQLDELGVEIGRAAHRQAALRRRRRRTRVVAAAVVATSIMAATAVGGLEYGEPSASTTPLNQQLTSCLRANGAVWTPAESDSSISVVSVPTQAVEHCAALDLAREAAGNGQEKTALWLQSFGYQPKAFWSCIGAGGFHVANGSGQRDDYNSAGFESLADRCAVANGLTLPAQP